MRSTAHTFTAPGSTPVGRFVSGHCSPPSPRGIPQGAHAGPCVTGRANRLWAFPLSVAFPRSESYAHTATPSGLGVSLSVSTPRRSTRLPIPLGASHVHDPGRLRRPTGGGSPLALPRSAAPQRAAGCTGAPAAALPSFLELRRYGFCFAAWAAACVGCPLRPGRTGDPFPGGSPPLQVEAPENVSATHRLLQTCLLRTGPFQGMLLTSESGL